MRRERQIILSMVAAGRISATEAERLLHAWNESREWIWTATVIVLVCIAHLQGSIHSSAVIDVAHQVMSAIQQGWREAISVLSKGMGGTI